METTSSDALNCLPLPDSTPVTAGQLYEEEEKERVPNNAKESSGQRSDSCKENPESSRLLIQYQGSKGKQREKSKEQNLVQLITTGPRFFSNSPTESDSLTKSTTGNEQDEDLHTGLEHSSHPMTKLWERVKINEAVADAEKEHSGTSHATRNEFGAKKGIWAMLRGVSSINDMNKSEVLETATPTEPSKDIVKKEDKMENDRIESRNEVSGMKRTEYAGDVHEKSINSGEMGHGHYRRSMTSVINSTAEETTVPPLRRRTSSVWNFAMNAASRLSQSEKGSNVPSMPFNPKFDPVHPAITQRSGNEMEKEALKFAEARHVLKTEEDIEVIRYLGLQLEEEWREKSRQISCLQTRKEELTLKLLDLGDTNHHLRHQVGSLSEDIVQKEQNFENLQRITLDHHLVERKNWGKERDRMMSNLEEEKRDLERMWGQERAICAQLRCILLDCFAQNQKGLLCSQEARDAGETSSSKDEADSERTGTTGFDIGQTRIPPSTLFAASTLGTNATEVSNGQFFFDVSLTPHHPLHSANASQARRDEEALLFQQVLPTKMLEALQLPAGDLYELERRRLSSSVESSDGTTASISFPQLRQALYRKKEVADEWYATVLQQENRSLKDRLKELEQKHCDTPTKVDEKLTVIDKVPTEGDKGKVFKKL